MKIIKSWLKEYINYDLTDDELASKLVETGTEVEEIVQTLDSKIVVAKILKITAHPNADKLKIVEVTDGEQKHSVVCGASNIKENMMVPFAMIGAKVGEIVIKEVDLRGVMSSGMLCSERELGIGDDHIGIFKLSTDFELGAPLAKYIPSESIFNLEITPNRGDCLSHIGIAREVGAILSKNVKKEPIALQMSAKKASENLSVIVEAPELCPEYCARILDGVKIGPSPKWLSDRLTLLGLKPINNVVDATNYIMYDLGQPLHAFDADKVGKNNIIIRKAKKGEKLIPLDGNGLVFSGGELIIADAKKSLAVAGIMGGAESGITEATTKIILESANFNPKSIRQTSKSLGLKSDASYRFERGIDEGGLEYAINKAAKLIKELAGGSIFSGIVKDGAVPAKKTIAVDYKNINNVLNTSLSNEEIDLHLKKLGFETQAGNTTIPLYRHDIEFWQDLAEEVGRIYGYGKISPLKLPPAKAVKPSLYHKKEYLKNLLFENGFNEVLSYSFLSEKDVEAAKIDTKNLVEVLNPVQPENKYMRNSLIPKLLFAVAKNPSFDSTPLFEIGNTFSGKTENTNLAVVTAGKGSKEMIEKIKEILENLLKNKVNVVLLDREDLQRFKIKKPEVHYFEFKLDKVLSKQSIDAKNLKLKLNKSAVHYRPVSRFPSVTRDIAFIVSKEVEAVSVSNDIYEISANINRVELFDEFVSDKFGKGKKNIAYHINIQDISKTMTDKEGDKIVEDIISQMSKKYKAKLRDK